MAANGLVIVGSGSQARYVIDIVAESRQFRVDGIADTRNWDNVGKRINDVPVTCVVEDIRRCHDPSACRVVVAYGKNDRKRELVRLLETEGFQFATLISPSAHISPFAEIGAGCIVNPLATVLPNAHVGRHAVIHSQAVIEHDNTIGDYANIGPGVSLGGRVCIGEGTYVYTGASVIPDVRVGRWTVVAAGAVVIRDVPDGDVVAGVPAKSIKGEGRT